MATPWTPPPAAAPGREGGGASGAGAAGTAAPVTSAGPGGAAAPKGTASTGSGGGSLPGAGAVPPQAPKARAPPAKVKPFKCEHCYEKTIGWDAADLIHPRTDAATAVRLSQLVHVSNTFSFLHTLFLKREQMTSRGPLDKRAYELATLYEAPSGNARLWCHFDTSANIFTQYEHLIGRNFSTFLALDLFLQHKATGARAYLQYKTDRFCTRVGMAMNDLKPSMYTVSHLQGVTRRLAVGGKVNMLHAHDRRVAAAVSAQFDTGAGVLALTATTARKLTATCTRRIAHPSTPNQENVTVAAELKLNTLNPAASTAALGYSLRFPMSNSVIKGSVDSLYKLRCTVESDLEFLAVRSFFSSRMDFRSHTYKFGIGFTMGGEFPKPRRDNNPLLGALRIPS